MFEKDDTSFLAVGRREPDHPGGRICGHCRAFGCGKNHLYEHLCRVGSTGQGKVFMDGEEIRGPSAERGVVFQQFALFPWKTVSENIEFGLKYRRIPRNNGRDREEVRSADQTRGVRKVLPPRAFRGMKQRVAIARVYANRPRSFSWMSPSAPWTPRPAPSCRKT